MFQVLYQVFFSKMKSDNKDTDPNKKNCIGCGKKISRTHTFCTYCGGKQDQSCNDRDEEETDKSK